MRKKEIRGIKGNEISSKRVWGASWVEGKGSKAENALGLEEEESERCERERGGRATKKGKGRDQEKSVYHNKHVGTETTGEMEERENSKRNSWRKGVVF